jgi:hypothetical protein
MPEFVGMKSQSGRVRLGGGRLHCITYICTFAAGVVGIASNHATCTIHEGAEKEEAERIP